jgi:hypothetical protein
MSKPRSRSAPSTPDLAAAAAKLLGEIAAYTDTLIELRHEALALPARARAVLEGAAKGGSSDPDDLRIALATAEDLAVKLGWANLRALKAADRGRDLSLSGPAAQAPRSGCAR